MPVLNTADDVKVGASQVDKVYLGATEVWSSSSPAVPEFTGGTITTPGDGYKYYTFNSSGTLGVVTGGDVEYAVVGGGGAGGGRQSGGGGAGGIVFGTVTVSVAQTVTVGAGGVHSRGDIDRSGSASSLGAISAPGGGGGRDRSGTPSTSSHLGWMAVAAAVAAAVHPLAAAQVAQGLTAALMALARTLVAVAAAWVLLAATQTARWQVTAVTGSMCSARRLAAAVAAVTAPLLPQVSVVRVAVAEALTIRR